MYHTGVLHMSCSGTFYLSPQAMVSSIKTFFVVLISFQLSFKASETVDGQYLTIE